ncbi:adenosylcobinamide-GDP ribazoletransferase [Paragemmobacter straminiformis]|uniref:Adenosylcobinamide-GDP ribazoletransferase n=1 Tax=Paragemmobacter straminiformis TaxID=2045119 RepID=A0A842I353_9RHOB|nr:adenosylcobinamide-GDP ribazoletransferase [Gemmobacter straminiformis]MBC2833903.1 adenosylcobinamide-GDP ribazoletransferase [Gemmobacter straminiformis]
MRPSDTDPARLALQDLVSAFGLLTRLPVPQGWPMRGAASAWAWPVVGLAVALVAAAAGSLALALGLPAGVAAAVTLAASALVTGAMHEDGLADTTDGLFGGWSRERRLEIMKDSAIGSYGTLALVFTALTRWSALTALMAAGAHWAGLVAAAALGRAAMAVVMQALPNARDTGLSSSVGRPGPRIAAASAAIALVIAALATGTASFAIVPTAALAALAVALLARARIGGQTGDILGATQFLAETAALATAAALLV